MRMKVAGWVTLSKAEEPLQIYTIHPSVGHGAFPLAQSCCRPDSPQSCLSISHAREAHRGVVITKGQFVILVSLHHRSHYLGLLSIKKKLLMWARKCVLCHYATEATDFTLHRFKLNEPETITPVKKRSQLRRCELPWTFKLRPGGNTTSDPYVNILCTNCTAAQSPWWSRHFHRRRILLLVPAQCCLRALTPAPKPANTDC